MSAKNARRVRDMSATYNTARFLFSETELTKLTRRIVRAIHPEMIILFGSRRYGKPRANSDLDLLVVMKQIGDEAKRMRQIRVLLPKTEIPFDIHTRSTTELARHLAMGDDFIQEIVALGKPLYTKRTPNGASRRVRQALEQGRTEPMDNAEVVHEWVAKAEGNFKTIVALARLKKNLNPDDLCWTCEQCAEKYLKAFLTRRRVKFDRDHNLEKLCEQCLAIDNDFRLIQTHIDRIAAYLPKIRYPGNSVTEEQARAAFGSTKPIRKFVRAKLGLGT